MISYYGGKFHGRKTASGVPFDKNALTAAHRTLPFGTRVKVTNLDNGRSVIVTVNDRGPYAHGRILDLSEAAAREIGLISKGTTKARITVL
jgi:rare lipoprotein A